MTALSDAARRRTFHTLDGLRGVAALAVVLLHYHPSVAPLALPSAYLAVDLFFMMSGIVIAHCYDAPLRGPLTPGRFLLIRIIRLYPLYLLAWALASAQVVVALVLGVSNWSVGGFVPAAIWQAAMLPDVSGSAPRPDLYPLNAPAWSLFWELAINLAYAFLLPWLSTRVVAVVAGLSAVLLAWTAFEWGGLDHGSAWAGWPVGAVRVSFSFFTGVLIERARLSGTLPRFKVPPIVLVVATALILAAPLSWSWVKDAGFVLVLFPLLCIAAIQNDPRHPKLFTFFGLISYPIYVTHIPLPYEKLFAFLFKASSESLAPWSGVALLGAMVLVAWIVARWIDVPVRRLLTKVLLPRAASR